MAISLKNLFAKKEEPTAQPLDVVGTTMGGDIVVAKNVNWVQLGITDAGSSKGDVTSFRAGFTSCFNRVRHSQQLDQELQDKLKEQLNVEKISLEGDLTAARDSEETVRQKLDTATQQVAQVQRKLNDAQHGIVNKERTVRLNFLIGVAIVALLTIYLFIFYSSTAYSAFFRNFDAGDGLNVAMFDGNAVIDAFRSSFFEGCFCLFMPVIFLALGYVAHGFSTTSKGFVRYVKTLLLYIITFAFDFLLAYKISKAFYEIEAAMSLAPLPPYSIKLAFAEEDFWIVIFCGFVSYVIWGLAFGFVMDCYDRLTNNKYELASLYDELNEAQSVVSKHQNELSTIRQKIAQLEADIKKKEHEIQTTVRYNFALIKQALADYYKGWVSYFALASIDANPLQTIYNKEMEAINEWMNKQ